MTNEEIAVELARQEQHLKSQAHRIDELEISIHALRGEGDSGVHL